MNAHELETLITAAWAESGAPTGARAEAVMETMKRLDRGELRVAEPAGEEWRVNAWTKHAILLYFRLAPMERIELSPFAWLDKIPVKDWREPTTTRVVPPAVVRFGAAVRPGAILMPSFVNIGAFVDEGTMVDTWATVGSCAQVGKHVHLSGGVGLGGVLEPAQAQPVIIEDGCFLGSRVIVVEGVRVRRGAVLGAGVTLTASTAIIDVRGPREVITKGEVPANVVVIPGVRDKKFPAGTFAVPCALIIGERKESTDRKTSLNQALREFDVPV